jgi:hypothetical protein
MYLRVVFYECQIVRRTIVPLITSFSKKCISMKTRILLLSVFLAAVAAGCSKSSDNNSSDNATCTWKTVYSENFQHSDTAGVPGFTVFIQPTPYGGSGFADIYNNSLRISSDSVYWAVVYKKDVEASRSRVSIECTTPPSGGTCAFAVGGKFTNGGASTQSGYLAAAMNNGIGIYKIANGSMNIMTSAAYQVQYSHTYKLTLTIDGGSLSMIITDKTTETSASLTGTDTSPLTGLQYSLNGNSLGGQVVLVFNNFLIETCQ